jgi:hypothetical protein
MRTGVEGTMRRLLWMRVPVSLALALAVTPAAADVCLPSLAEEGRRLHEMPAPSVHWPELLLRQHEACAGEGPAYNGLVSIMRTSAGAVLEFAASEPPGLGRPLALYRRAFEKLPRHWWRRRELARPRRRHVRVHRDGDAASSARRAPRPPRATRGADVRAARRSV